MLRRVVGTLVVLVFCAGVLLADEAKGKVKKFEKGVLTVTIEDKEKEFKLNKETKVYNGDKELERKEGRKFLKELKEGTEVTIIYEKDGDKITVKEIKVKSS